MHYTRKKMKKKHQTNKTNNKKNPQVFHIYLLIFCSKYHCSHVGTPMGVSFVGNRFCICFLINMTYLLVPILFCVD